MITVDEKPGTAISPATFSIYDRVYANKPIFVHANGHLRNRTRKMKWYLEDLEQINISMKCGYLKWVTCTGVERRKKGSGIWAEARIML